MIKWIIHTSVLNPTEPANYTGSWTAEYRVIIAGILKEVIKTAPIFTKSYLIELYICAYAAWLRVVLYMTLITPIMDL